MPLDLLLAKSRNLTAAQYDQTSDSPPDAEWLAKIVSKLGWNSD